MLFLVTADNLLQLFLGWEGVGLCSFLLINFWFSRLQANKAAVKAIVVNRIGDAALIFASILCFIEFHSLDFASLFCLAPSLSNSYIPFFGYYFHSFSLISFFLFIAAVGKSAQLGLHTWLPDAMEGPTPVSALIHAATMVTAGVFLLIRCSPVLEFAPSILTLITFFGSLTAFFASTTAAFQYDLKRVIAFSTCSQLGYMFIAIGLSKYSLALFHLVNHAFFKALLFLSAGSVIHALYDEQDMRRMGQLRQFLPFTYIFMVIGSLSLMGLPFLTGFYSKDVILELTFFSFEKKVHFFAAILGLLAACCTSWYSIRLVYLTFLDSSFRSKTFNKTIKETYSYMFLSMFILALFTIFAGFLFKDLFFGMGSPSWSNSIYYSSTGYQFDQEFLAGYELFKTIPLFFTIYVAFFSYIVHASFSYFDALFMRTFRHFFEFFLKKWFFDTLYNQGLAHYFLKLGYKGTFKSLDRGLLEFLGPDGFSLIIAKIGKTFSLTQTGYIYHYLIIFSFGLFSIYVFLFFFSSLTEYLLFSLVTLFFLNFFVKA